MDLTPYERQLSEESSKFSDIQFNFPNGKTIKSHKIYLTKDSKYFELLFSDVKGDQIAFNCKNDYEVYLYYLCLVYNVKPFPISMIDNCYDFAERLVLFLEKIESKRLEMNIRFLYPVAEDKRIYSNAGICHDMSLILAAEMNLIAKKGVCNGIDRLLELVKYDARDSIRFMTPTAAWIYLNQLAYNDSAWFEFIIKELFYFSKSYINGVKQEIWDILLYVCIKYKLNSIYIYDNLVKSDGDNVELHEKIKAFNMKTITDITNFDTAYKTVSYKIDEYKRDDIFVKVKRQHERDYDEGYH